MRWRSLSKFFRHSAKRRILVWIIGVLLLALPLAGLGLRARAMPLALPIFRSIAESRVDRMVREVAGSMLSEEGSQAFCAFSYSADGSVRGLLVDSERANRFVSEFTYALEEQLAEIELSCQIRSGDLLFPRFFSGSGIPLTVRGSLYGGASAKLVSSLTEGSINQTLHRIEVEVTVPLTLTVLGETEQFTVTSLILLGEAVIVGNTVSGVEVRK